MQVLFFAYLQRNSLLRKTHHCDRLFSESRGVRTQRFFTWYLELASTYKFGISRQDLTRLSNVQAEICPSFGLPTCTCKSWSTPGQDLLWTQA